MYLNLQKLWGKCMLTAGLSEGRDVCRDVGEAENAAGPYAQCQLLHVVSIQQAPPKVLPLLNHPSGCPVQEAFSCDPRMRSQGAEWRP